MNQNNWFRGTPRCLGASLTLFEILASIEFAGGKEKKDQGFIWVFVMIFGLLICFQVPGDVPAYVNFVTSVSKWNKEVWKNALTEKLDPWFLLILECLLFSGSTDGTAAYCDWLWAEVPKVFSSEPMIWENHFSLWVTFYDFVEDLYLILYTDIWRKRGSWEI